MKPLLVLCVFAALILSGCATLIGGSTQRIQLESNPPGAKVSVNGQTVGTTPFELTVKIDQPAIIDFKKEGFEDKSVSMDQDFGRKVGAVWLVSDVLGGLILLPTTFAIVNINTPGNFFDKSNNPGSIGVVLGLAVALTPLVVDAWTKRYSRFPGSIATRLCPTSQTVSKAWPNLHKGMSEGETNQLLGINGCFSEEFSGPRAGQLVETFPGLTGVLGVDSMKVETIDNYKLKFVSGSLENWTDETKNSNEKEP